MQQRHVRMLARPWYAHAGGAVFVFFVFATLTHPAHAETGKQFAVSIDNFGKISDNYYRGGQPNLIGFVQLRMMGIRCVIDLQEHAMRVEPFWVRALGMEYFNIPLSSKRPANSSQTQYFLKLVNNPENWPVYVHCAGGRHRTGEMTAIYRITHDSWSADRAYEEMKYYDYYSHGGHGSLKDYVFQFYSLYLVAPFKVVPLPAATAK